MKTIYRILDANLDRAREGLRVIEEWCRFDLNNSSLTAKCKHLRQELAAWHREEFRLARSTETDVGTALSHPSEETKKDIPEVLRANLCRVQEALRVLEEYSKIYDINMAIAVKRMRYEVYIIESEMNLSPQNRHQQLQKSLLYLVTMPSTNLLATVEAALQGGLSLVQYRDKEIDDRSRLAIARSLCELCHSYNALFLVNDRVDIALAVGADGVHLGQTDLPVKEARSLLGDRIIGQSTTNHEELQTALNSQVDYIGVGPFYATPTKPGKAALDRNYVDYVVKNVSIPWYAIGGIDPENLAEVTSLGATRVAVVRSLMMAPDPKLTTQNMLNLLKS